MFSTSCLTLMVLALLEQLDNHQGLPLSWFLAGQIEFDELALVMRVTSEHLQLKRSVHVLYMFSGFSCAFLDTNLLFQLSLPQLVMGVAQGRG